MAGLSKSRIMDGLQCPKRLYLHVRRRDLKPPTTDAQQLLFIQGRRATVEARTRFPGGVLIDEDPRAADQAIERTREAMDRGAPAIFEAAFAHEGVLVRVDVLARAGSLWEIIEVKSSTSVKPEHLDDVAVQAWVLEGARIPVSRVLLMHVNNRCAFPDLRDLFARQDVTDEARARRDRIPGLVASLAEVLRGEQVPAIDIGPHCKTPYSCPFETHCRDEHEVRSPSVFEIPKLGKGAWKYYEQGIKSLLDPRLTGLREGQERIVEIVRSGKRSVDAKAIASALKPWRWPLHFLDFETASPVIPRFAGTCPYQQIPFQFSCFVQDSLGSEPRHFEYLHGDESDPRPAVARALVAAVGEEGSVVAYNRSAERQSLEELARACPDLSARLLGIAERLVDPKPIVEKNVYDAAFAGSFSLKSVAPALLGPDLSYDGMDVSGGQAAQLAFDELIAPTTPAARKREIRGALLAYCRQDTWAMVRLVDWMRSASS